MNPGYCKNRPWWQHDALNKPSGVCWGRSTPIGLLWEWSQTINTRALNYIEGCSIKGGMTISNIRSFDSGSREAYLVAVDCHVFKPPFGANCATVILEAKLVVWRIRAISKINKLHTETFDGWKRTTHSCTWWLQQSLYLPICFHLLQYWSAAYHMYKHISIFPIYIYIYIYFFHHLQTPCVFFWLCPSPLFFVTKKHRTERHDSHRWPVVHRWYRSVHATWRFRSRRARLPTWRYSDLPGKHRDFRQAQRLQHQPPHLKFEYNKRYI